MSSFRSETEGNRARQSPLKTPASSFVHDLPTTLPGSHAKVDPAGVASPSSAPESLLKLQLAMPSITRPAGPRV